MMGQAHETPFATDVLQPAPQEAPEPTRFFDRATHWRHDDFASGVYRTPYRGAHFRCHALFGRGGGLSSLSLRPMGALPARRHVRIKAPLLHGGGRRLARIAAVIDGRTLLCGTSGVLRSLEAR